MTSSPGRSDVSDGFSASFPTGLPAKSPADVPARNGPEAPGGSALFRLIRTLTTTDLSRAMDLYRRVTYLMLFRLVVISLVLGATILLWWLSDVDLSSPNSLVLFAIIATTYLLTIIYSLALNRVADPKRLADVQLVADLIISTLLVHLTGGAQSAYTFFFPLSIIAAATTRFRAGAMIFAAASMVLFSAVSVLGWLDILPSFAGQRLSPSSLTSVELGRSLALNLAAFAGVAVLAYNLGGQIQQTSASLESQRTQTADLRALYEDIVRCLSSGLVTIDRQGLVSTINRQACEILAIAPEIAIGNHVTAVLPGVGKALAGLDEKQEMRRAEISVPRPERSDVTLGISVSPLRNNREDVVGRIINFQDLTEMRAMEAQVRHAERLAMVGSLAAGVAHEIRNPLAAISGSIELLGADPGTDDDSQALMEIVTREVDRLNALVTDLLDYTNPQPRELLHFDLLELVRETLTVFEQDRNLGAVEISLATDSESEALYVDADPSRIRQVLWNLLRNAATAAKSEVVVRVAGKSSQATIEVIDDGPGIAPELLPRVFDPFFTTKSRGSGLGLATCHSIVTEHGGEICVDSTPGQGTQFSVFLPSALAADG